MDSISLSELPYRHFLKFLIILGLSTDTINTICRKWNLLIINNTNIDNIRQELNINGVLKRIIQKNKDLIKSGKTPKINQKIKTEFKFPLILDKLLQGMENFALTEDLDEIELPEEIAYVLFNYRLRPFIECGKAVDFSFYQLNRIWQRFNPVGILHEYYDIYLYYFWDIESIYPSEILSYIKSIKEDHYYDIHTKILGQDATCFLGYYGFQDEIQYQQILRKMMLLLPEQMEKNSYGAKELISLFRFCSKEFDMRAVFDYDPDELPSQVFHNDISAADNIDQDSAKMKVWRKNQEYYFNKDVFNKINM